MARGVNKAIIVGNLGQDPEVRQAGGSSVTMISVATNEKWKDKNTGEDKERTEWHRIAIWGRLGEVAAQYLRKGSEVYIEGSIRTSKYQDKETGADRYSTDIVAQNMQLLGGNGGGGNNRPVPGADGAAGGAPGGAPAAAGDFDDDIPF